MQNEILNLVKRRGLMAVLILLGWHLNAAAQDSIRLSGPASFCAGDSVILTAKTTSPTPTYQWLKNTDTIPNATNETLKVFEAGKYAVIIKKNGKDTTLAAVTITVNPNPTAAFSFSPNQNCATVPVYFDNNSTGANLGYAWNFGNPASGGSNTSTAANPSHRFIPNAGAGNQNFQVRLIVTTAFGCRDTAIQQVTVKQLPPAQLGGTGEGQYDGKTYFKVCSGVNNADITIVNQNNGHPAVVSNRVVWGDQSPDFVSAGFVTQNHNYQLGIYNLQLIVTGTNGCIDTAQYGTFIGSNPAVGLSNPGNTSICTGSSLTFPITSTLQNPPGTTYTVVFNDNSPSIQFSQPPPNEVTHKFDLLSCGITSNGYSNSFSATIIAANPCLTSQGVITPIYVSQKPTAQFTISPGDTVCVNKQVVFTNTSPANKFINGGNCQDGKMVWKITPATGWTTTGILGNDLGLSDPSLWQSGSTGLPVTFTTRGTYTIKLKLGNTICGLDSITKTICVNPEPVAAFSIDANEGCAPLSVKTTNNSNQPDCGVNTHQWTVSYSPFAGCQPNTSDYELLNNTTLTSAEPVFRFKNPGIYTLSLTIKNSSGLCVSDPVNRQITVRDKPNISFSSPATVCQTFGFTPSVTSFNNCGVVTPETYLWNFSGGTPSSATTASPGTIRYNNDGNYTIKLSATNVCGTTEVSRPITVNPTPVITVPAPVAVCQGQQAGPFTFTATPGGGSFAWTNNNTGIGLGASGTGPINAFTATNAGTNPLIATINATPSLGSCTGIPQSFTVTVNPRPSAPSATNPVYCAGDAAAALSANASPGNTLLWYTNATGGSPISTPTPSTSLPGITSYYVSQQVPATGCESPRTQVQVTVRQVPVIALATGTNPLSCASATGSITLTGLNANTSYQVNYTRDGAPLAVTLTANAAGNIIINNLVAGIYNNIRVTLNGCQSAAAGPVSLSDPNPPATPVATGPANLCSGNLLSLSASSATPGAVTYQWSGPNGFNSPLQNPSLANVTTAASGVYSVIARLAGCTSAAGTVSVQVNQTPAITAGSNSPVCEGESLNLSASSSTPGGVTFAWTGPNNFTSATANPTVSTTVPANAGNYSVVATLGNCSSSPFPLTVTIRPTPVIAGTNFTNPTSCATATGTITLSGLTANTLYQVNYTRGGTPVAVSLTANGAGNILINNLLAGTYDNFRVTLNGCPSATAGPVALSDPNPPATPVAGSNGPVCSGNTLNFTASTTTPGAVTYQWSGPNGFNSPQQNPSLANVTTAASGLYSVVARLAGCTSAAGSVNVQVNQTPAITAGSNSPVCEGSPLNLSASSSTPGAVTFAWSGPGSFSSADPNPTITNSVPANAGNYSVVATLGNCASAPFPVAVVIKPMPVIGSIASANPTICATANGSITLSGLSANTSYQVNYTRGGTPVAVNLTANGAGNILINNLLAGTYDNFRVTLNGCQSAAAGPVTLSDPNPPATPVAASNGPVCSGNTLNFTASTTTPGAVTYQWSGPNGFNSPQQNPSLANVTTAASGLYSVVARLAGCTSAAGTVNVQVNQTPAITAGSNSPVCEGTPLNLTASSSTPGTVTFAWTGPDNFTSTLANPSIASTIPGNAGNYSVTATLGNCSSAPFSVAVIIKPKPVIGAATFTDPTNCNLLNGTITLNGLLANTAYQVSFSQNGNAQSRNLTANGAGQLTITGLGPGNYTDIRVTLNGCISEAAETITLKNPNPPATPVIATNSPVCVGSTLTLSATTATPGNATFRWTGPNGFTSAIANPAIANATTGNSGTYTVTATINGCVSENATINIVVTPSAAGANAGPDQQICNQSTAKLSGNSPGNGQGRWEVLPPSTATIIQQANPAAEVSGLPVGITRLVWHVNNNVCPPSADTVEIVNLPPLQSHIEPLANTICTGQSAVLTGLQPTGGTGTFSYQWQLSTNNIQFTDIAGATAPNLTVNPLVNTWYRRVVKSGACTIFGDTALLNVLPAITQNTIGNSQDICINTAPATLVGDIPSGGGGLYTYQWQESTNNGNNWTNISGATQKDYSPGILVENTQYRRLAQTALCNGPQTSVSNLVSIKVNPDAKAQMNPAPLISCTPFRITPFIINLTQYADRNETYNWYANNTFIGSGTLFPGFTISSAGDSVLVKLITISRFGCKPDSVSAIFRTVVKPTLSFTASDTVGCGPLQVNFTNTTPNKERFVYEWNFGNGKTSIQTDPGSIIFAPNPNFGDTVYTVTLKASAGCDTFSVSQKIRVRAKAKVSISPDKVQGCSPARFTFTNVSRGSGATYTWDFGDGSPRQTTSNASVQHSYNVGTRTFFTVKLISNNDCGSDTGSVVILVTPNPIRLDLLVNANEINGCAPQTIHFINNTTGANQFRYNFGDGSPELVTTTSFDTLVHTYLNEGSYTVTMTAGNGCTDTTTTRNIEVRTAPMSQFTYNVNTTCIGQPVSFQNQTAPGNSVVWRFGDGTSSSLANPQKVFQKPGTYKVTHYASTSFGQGFTCTDSSSATIIVRDTLTGDFSVDSLGSCAPFLVTFKSSLRPAQKTTWDFGDGGIANGDSVVHAFATAGNYLVQMYSTVAGGCTYRGQKTITVNGPSGKLDYTAPFACQGVAVPFKVTTGNTARFIYYFGNGDSVSTTNNSVNYAYPAAGTYLPKVILQSGNCRNELVGLDSIKVDRVIAAIQQRNTPGCDFTDFHFTDAGQTVFGKGKWQWGFGDGTGSTLQHPVKKYAAAGIYNIGLKLTGLSGCSDSVTIPVRVDIQKTPKGAILGDSIACIDQVLGFSSLITNADSLVSISWNFGNGQNATGSLATASYAQGGLYTVSMISRTAFGCADTAKKTIRVSIAPLVSAGPDRRICRGEKIQLQATGAATYAWSPTEGLSCANCSNPVAQPLVNTTYIITGTNAIGCKAYDTVQVAVVQPFNINFSASDTICLGEKIQLGASGAPGGYTWTPATGLNSSSIANPVASPSISTTYRVIGYDNFNCFNDTGFVTIDVGQIPTVDLGTGGEIIAGNQVRLQPVLTNGPFVNYAWTPSTGLSCSNCPSPFATITTNVTYRLTVTNPYGCSASDTIGFRVQCVESEQVYIPNAFSPDNDGVNDVFMVRGKGLARVKHFRVFNRYGQVVFERNNFDANDPANGWDGKVNGIPASPDVYVFTAELLCTGGVSYFKKGNVTLVR